jgi:hypothetical protein
MSALTPQEINDGIVITIIVVGLALLAVAFL